MLFENIFNFHRIGKFVSLFNDKIFGIKIKSNINKRALQ